MRPSPESITRGEANGFTASHEENCADIGGFDGHADRSWPSQAGKAGGLVDYVRLSLHELVELLLQLAQLRKAALAGLGVDQAAVHSHLETTSAAGHEAQTLDQVAVLVKNLLRRPGGSKEIVSRHTVLDLNGQLLALGHLLPPLRSS